MGFQKDCLMYSTGREVAGQRWAHWRRGKIEIETAQNLSPGKYDSYLNKRMGGGECPD